MMVEGGVLVLGSSLLSLHLSHHNIKSFPPLDPIAMLFHLGHSHGLNPLESE